ncbi:MAG: homoserine kinase, partial [Acidobacteriia bacterium]|nr:homoserine kinase [Terriglobia bacterium]
MTPWSTVRAPASSANLGPGFDALGMALGVYLTCRFRRSDELTIQAEGRDAGCISTGPDNLIWQTAVAVAEKHGA